MTAWRTQLRRARFRDAEFFVQSADTEEGRRGVLHEYPQRNDPYVEDMGRKAGEFTLEALVLGEGYFAARDALRAALKTPGPGELVHPTLGRMQVALTAPYRFVESLVDAGGMARFTLRFTEAGENTEPATSANTAVIVGARADAAAAESVAEFADGFSVQGTPEFVAADAMRLLADAAAALGAARSGVLPDLTVAGEFNGEVSRFSSSLASLILTPTALAEQVFGLTAGLRGSAARPFDALGSLASFFGYTSTRPAAPATTPARRAQADNRAAIEALMQRAATIEAARTAASIDFAAAATGRELRITLSQAVAWRERIADAIEDTAVSARIEAFGAMMDLRAAVVRDITVRGADLPRIASITLPATLPALVVAYRAFGDATRDAEIVARNNIGHPGFIPGGVALEVLA